MSSDESIPIDPPVHGDPPQADERVQSTSLVIASGPSPWGVFV